MLFDRGKAGVPCRFFLPLLFGVIISEHLIKIKKPGNSGLFCFTGLNY